MSRNRFLPILLAAALVAQAVIAGWGHSHAHQCGTPGFPTVSHIHAGLASHAHHPHAAGNRQYDRNSQERLPLSNEPSDKDDCSVCRHLALAAMVTLDLEPMVIGETAETVQVCEAVLFSTITIGLHRPRSPPELS